MKITILKKGAIGPGMIKGAIIALLMLTIFVSILPSLLKTASGSVSSLATEYANTTRYGTSASAIGVQIDDWLGYFWVLGPLVLLISIIVGLFMRRR